MVKYNDNKSNSDENENDNKNCYDSNSVILSVTRLTRAGSNRPDLICKYVHELSRMN